MQSKEAPSLYEVLDINKSPFFEKERNIFNQKIANLYLQPEVAELLDNNEIDFNLIYIFEVIDKSLFTIDLILIKVLSKFRFQGFFYIGY